MNGVLLFLGVCGMLGLVKAAARAKNYRTSSFYLVGALMMCLFIVWSVNPVEYRNCQDAIEAYERGVVGSEPYYVKPWNKLALAYWRCNRWNDARDVGRRIVGGLVEEGLSITPQSLQHLLDGCGAGSTFPYCPPPKQLKKAQQAAGFACSIFAQYGWLTEDYEQAMFNHPSI